MVCYSCVECASGAAGEDRVRVVERDGNVVAVVADGAGGMGGGAAAADLVVSALTEWRGDVQRLRDTRYWVMRLLEIDAALATAGGGQAAAVVASVCDGEVVGAAVGDAVAWSVSASGIDDLTARAPRKPLLGDGDSAPFAYGPVRLASSTLLLATDGLWKYAPRAAIAGGVLSSPVPGRCDGLADLVRLRNGGLQDDVGAVLIRAVRSCVAG